MTGLRDILDLPETVTKGSFVIKLAEAVHRPEALLATYAVTPNVHAVLDKGLAFIGTALAEKRNVATFVHGSFGSGKSHYMAVLSLLAGDDPRPWQEPALHDLRARHPWVGGKKLLRIHLNMIDAPSLGDKIFRAYLEMTQAAHPEAPIAPLFADAGLFANAASLRATMGDEPFFRALNEGQQRDARWGKRADSAWDAARFEAACASSASAERGELFTALTRKLLPAFLQQSSEFLGFEHGMLAMTRHAKDLGYDAIVFFLDELVLWLVSRASNPEVLNNEIGKLAKLVEGQAADQAVPIVTFAARQRDIGELVGEQYAGRDAETTRNNLKLWHGRFETLQLPDGDLPAIIAKRVVHPKDDVATKVLNDAFEGMRGGLGNAWGTLLGADGTEQAFRQVYPFSPALVDVLVAMSHYLQRERTALKLLVEMLTDRLEDFEIGKVVPVGELYDSLAEGEEPMDGTMRDRFAAAKRIYEGELLPMIREDNGTASAAKCQRLAGNVGGLGCANCREMACRNDNRLVKTLLLAALAPNTKVFRGLTASRLVQLNHGTLRSPVPGLEATNAAQKIRRWSERTDKVRLDGEADPQVRIVLDGVDLRPIIAAASTHDSLGARKAKLRELLFTVLGLDEDASVIEKHKIEWRKTDRFGAVHFGNVREMDDTTLRNGDDDAFKFIIDYPFDEHGKTPQDDEQRLEQFLQTMPNTRTVVWLPSFLSDKAQKDLAELVVLDRMLEGDIWRGYVANLRPDDQLRAREGLDALARQKRDLILRALHMAYGVQRAEAGILDPTRSVTQNLYALRAEVKIRSTAAGTLALAMTDALTQLLGDVWPQHPQFPQRVTKPKLEKELEMLSRLVEADGQRLALQRAEADALQFSDALHLVVVRDGQATIAASTYDDLDQKLRLEGIETPTVKVMKRLLDPSGVRGLTDEVADFEVAAYARIRGRELVRGSTVVTPVLGKLDDEIELRPSRLPSEEAWHRAIPRAAALFGIAVGRAHTLKNLVQLGKALEEKVGQAKRDGAQTISGNLQSRQAFFEGTPPRLRTARKASELVASLSDGDALTRVEALAAFTIGAETSDAALAKHFLTSRGNGELLAGDVNFMSFEPLKSRPHPDAAAILGELRTLLEGEELLNPLAAKLPELSVRAQRLLARPAPTPVEVARAAGASGPASMARTVRSADDLDTLRKELDAALATEGALYVTWARKP